MDEPLQKLAIVLQLASTGGWRYVQRLVEGLRSVRPALEITCFLGQPVLQSFASDQPITLLKSLGAQVAEWPEIAAAPPAGKFRPLRAYRHRQASEKFQRWLSELNRFDAVFFAWPYGLECPRLQCPIVFIPHDFNYLHFAGSWSMTLEASQRQQEMHAQWLRRATPIVSSRFISNELTTNFPECPKPVDVIPLARLSQEQRLPDENAKTIVESLGVRGEYILSPNNVSHHKNFGQVLAACYYLRQQYANLQLVVCGHNTEGITGYLRSPLYLDRTITGNQIQEPPHVVSVGMRSDREVAALIQRASLVVNASLYEAGNGSGLDAWSLGSPVVMSDIPAFVEHISTLGVRAELFHPRDCFSLRDAMQRILADPERAHELAADSQAAMQKYTWVDVAQRYLHVFDRVISSRTG